MELPKFLEKLKGNKPRVYSEEEILAANQNLQAGDEIVVIDVLANPTATNLLDEAEIRYLIDYADFKPARDSLGRIATLGAGHESGVIMEFDPTVQRVIPLPPNYHEFDPYIFSKALDKKNVAVIESPEAIVWPPEGNDREIWENYAARLDKALEERRRKGIQRP